MKDRFSLSFKAFYSIWARLALLFPTLILI